MREKIILISVILVIIVAGALTLRHFVLGDTLTESSSKAGLAANAKAYLSTYRNTSLYSPSLENLNSKQIVSRVSDLKDTDLKSNDLEAFGRFRKNLISYIAKLEDVDLGSFGPDTSAKLKEKTLSSIDEGGYADQANTILENPGFESLSSDGSLVGWQKNVGGILKPVNTVDTKIYRSDVRSLKLSPANHAKTEFIKVDKSKLYHFSLWAKTGGSETQFRIYPEFYDVDHKSLGNSNGSYRACTEQTSANGNWQRYVDTAWSVPTTAVYLTYVIHTNCSTTDIYFDDASIIDAKEGINEIGCRKSDNSSCIDLGQSNLGSAKITADNGTKVDSAISVDSAGGSEFRYRTIPWYGYSFQIPAFNVDDGYNPKSQMLLEVRYKDNYNNYASSGINAGRWYLGKANDLFDPSENLVLDALKTTRQSYAPLGGRGDNQWKIAQALIDTSPYPGLKAKDGFFNLKIFNQWGKPSLTTGKIEIPVSYISIKSINATEAEMFKRKERELYGYNKIIFKPTVDNQGDDYSDKQLVFFSYDSTRSIYPYTVPSKDEINKSLETTSFPGESESINAGIYSLSPADVNISVEKADEKSGIDSSDIKLFQVAYNHREKNLIVPDYLVDYQGSLKVGSSDAPTQGVWLKIKVPSTASAGDYKFNLKINSSSQNIVIPLTVKIIGIKLEEAPYQLISYSADPFATGGTVDVDQYLEFLKEYDFTPMTYYKSDNFIQFQDGKMSINKDNIADFESRIERFSRAGVLKKDTFVHFPSGKSLFFQIYDQQYGGANNFKAMSQDPDIYNKITNADFQSKYRQVLAEFDKIGDKYSATFYFSYADEVSGAGYQVIWQALQKIHEGQKTRIWETVYNTDVCEEKNSSATSPAYSVPNNKIKPLSDTIDSLVWSLTTSLSPRNPCQSATNAYYTTNISRIKDPVYHRYLGSIFAYANRVNIFTLYTMKPEGNPYDEFDKQIGLADFWRYSDSAIAYPTSFGKTYATPVTEAIHEGYKDAKLIATLEKLIKDCESSSLASSGLCGRSTAIPSSTASPTLSSSAVSPTLSPLPSPSSTATLSSETLICGDANRDGKVDILDLNVIISNWKNVTSKFNLVDSSKDEKGVINALDLSNVTSHWGCIKDKPNCTCDSPST